MVSAPPKPDVDSAATAPHWEGDSLVIRFPSGGLTDELFLAIANLNDDWRFERNCEGALEVSPPPLTLSGLRSARILAQLLTWAELSGGGECFGSGSGFSLASGALRDPDACWISDARLDAIDVSDEEYWQVCPELVVEVRSRGQTLRKQQEKMQEWMAGGARLGWLIDPFTDDGVTWIYREGVAEPERLERPESLSGEAVAKGLQVNLEKVWR